MTVILAGGGTGGHVFPLVAVADALHDIVPSEGIVFVGSGRGIETRVVPERGYELELLDAHPLRGAGLLGAFKGVRQVFKVIPSALELLDRRAPSVVFSVGGYAAGAISAAARLRGVPLALLEPNAVVGLANALTAPMVQRAYTAFPEAEAAFAPARVRRLGVPLRAGFEPCPFEPRGRIREVLVLGGSQGAKSLNEAVPEALAAFKDRIHVVHQCGPKHEEPTHQRYDSLGLSRVAQVVSFIDDVPSALAAADLVVSRSGASAVSEIAAIGRPSVLLPYPFAAGDHQRRNAEALERWGAAVCIAPQDDPVQALLAALGPLIEDESRLRAMASRAAAFGKPTAAREIARDLCDLAGIRAPSRDSLSSSPARAVPFG